MSIELENGLGNSGGSGGGGGSSTAKFDLFDTKTISEPTAQKGWSCISYPEQNKLDKADVPTAYDMLAQKLARVDSSIEGWQNIEYGWNFRTFIVDDNILILNNQNVYKCKIGEINDSTKWVNISFSISLGFDYSSNNNLCILITDKIVCFYVKDYNNGNNQYILVLDRFTLEEIKLIPISTSGKKPNYITLIENYIYYTVNNDTYKFLNSNVESEISPELMKSDLNIYNLFKKNSIYYIAEGYYDYSFYWRIFKTNDLTNGTLTKIADRIPRGHNTDRRLINYGQHFIYIQDNGSMLKSKNIEAWEDTGSWNAASKWDTITLDFTNFGSAYTTANGLGFAFRNQYGFVITYTLQDTNNSTGTFIYTTDFVNFQFIRKFTYSASIGNVVSPDTNGSYAQYNNQGQFYFSQATSAKTVYTDTINGIDIKYYKNGNYKICTPDIAVGNDDNLQSVFEFLGYLNYWWIDTTEEKITLQRNSNMWTFMYVGDDYDYEVENPDILPSGNSTRLLPQKNYVEDTTSATITFDEDNIIQPNTDYVFGTLTSLEFDTDSYVENQLETTIKFTAGTSFTFTDNSGITWVDGTPTFTEGSNYLILIFNNLAFIKEW